jgi:aspartate aminotransferase
MLPIQTVQTTTPLISEHAQGLEGNLILKIAYQVKALESQGLPVANFTIGDFDPSIPIPEGLLQRMIAQLEAGHTNYPLSMGTPELRKAIAQYYRYYLGIEYSADEVLVASGTRPLMYATFRTIVNPGEPVVFGAPSWNTDHYCYLVQAQPVAIATAADDRFLLTAAGIAPHVRTAGLVVLNTPSNPSGTVYTAEMLKAICKLVLTENALREAEGRKPLYVMYDHIYWMLSYEGYPHQHPVAIDPAMRPYTIYVDGISKSFAATGLRVGWGAGPRHVMEAMSKYVAHMGAWAPKPFQLATAEYLTAYDEQAAYITQLQGSIEQRLGLVFAAFKQMQADGLPVFCLPPQGGLLLSASFNILGRRTAEGTILDSDMAIFEFLLHKAGVAFVPFSAFGDTQHPEWFRVSVSGLATEAIGPALERIAHTLRTLEPVSSAITQ